MRAFRVVAIAVVVSALYGCRKPAPEPVPPTNTTAAVMEDYAARLARLEQQQSALMAAVQALREPRAESSPAVEPDAAPPRAAVRSEAVSLERIKAIMTEQVRDVVQATIDERIGDRQSIQAVFQEVVEEEVAAFEEKRQREEEEAAQRRQEERERERAEREEQRFNAFAEALGLSESQQESVRLISDNTRDTIRQVMSEMREDGGYAREDYRTAMGLIQTDQHEAMSKVLSEEQQKRYLEEYEGRIGGRFGGWGFRGGRSR